MAERVPHDEPVLTRTPQRDAALRAIRASATHMTAGHIFEAARAIQPRIGYATV